MSLLVMASCDSSGDLAPLAQQVQPSAEDELWLAPGRAPASNPSSFGLTARSVATANDKPMPPIIGLEPRYVCADLTYVQMDGKTVRGQKICELKPCTDTISTKCQTTLSHRATDLAYVKAHRNQFYPGLTIAGIEGTIDFGPLKPCQQSGDTDCLSTSNLRAVSTKIVHPGVLRKGFTVGKIKGAFPSAKYPPTPIPAGSIALTPKNFTAALRSTKPYHFWTKFGDLVQITGDVRLHKNNIKQGFEAYGVKGEGAKTAGPLCTKEGEKSCVVASDKAWLALNPADLDEKKLKNGIIFGDKTGIYPSAGAPLAGSGADIADLAITASSWSQLSTSDTYEYFDGEGRRYTVTGTKNLAAKNIAKDLTILGVKGSFEGLDPEAVAPTNLRSGLAIGSGRYGSLQITADCTSPADCFAAKKLWSRVEADGKLTLEQCTSEQATCVIRNAAQQQDWLFEPKSSPQSWHDAVNYCAGLEHMGFKDWRMPTQKELMQAAVGGLTATGQFGYYSKPLAELKFWTSTMYDGSNIITYSPENTQFTDESSSESAWPICVRTP